MTSANRDFSTRMAQAREVAQRALPRDVPVGALLINPQGEVVAEGWNQREEFSDITAHAELVALRRAGEQLHQWRFDGYTMVVTLEPCPMCASALLQARIGIIVFGAYDPIQGALGSALNMCQYYSTDCQILSGIAEESCRQQLQAFFQSRRP